MNINKFSSFINLLVYLFIYLSYCDKENQKNYYDLEPIKFSRHYETLSNYTLNFHFKIHIIKGVTQSDLMYNSSINILLVS